jgi:hypothetical protein
MCTHTKTALKEEIFHDSLDIINSGALLQKRTMLRVVLKTTIEICVYCGR